MKTSLAATLTVIFCIVVVIAANNMGYNVTPERWANAWLLICGSIGAAIGVFALLKARSERARVWAIGFVVVSLGLVSGNHWLTLAGCLVVAALGIHAHAQEPNKAPEPMPTSGTAPAAQEPRQP